MDILKRLWNWCRKPQKPFLAKFSRLATQPHIRAGTTSRTLVLAIVLTVVLIGMLSVIHMLAFHHPNTEIVGTIHIKDDGSVDPPTAPIKQDGDLYILTANIHARLGETYIYSKGTGVRRSILILVERSNIVIDGNGYTVEGNGEGARELCFYISKNGIRIRNVTVKNTNIKNFGSGGVSLKSASNCVIFGNNITNSGIGLGWSYNNTISENSITNSFIAVSFQWSFNNTVSENNLNNNDYGEYLYWSSNNTFSENNITNNDVGFNFLYSSNNHVYRNNITNNEFGIQLYTASNNTFYHNNFMNNTQQIYDYSWNSTSLLPSINVWDDGYPSGGNYWSDYTGVDLNHDGIGDAAYEIDEDNKDYYPLVDMF